MYCLTVILSTLLKSREKCGVVTLKAFSVQVHVHVLPLVVSCVVRDDKIDLRPKYCCVNCYVCLSSVAIPEHRSPFPQLSVDMCPVPEPFLVAAKRVI
jgi:hypothetical protein